jgi:hypothetical protein
MPLQTVINSCLPLRSKQTTQMTVQDLCAERRCTSHSTAHDGGNTMCKPDLQSSPILYAAICTSLCASSPAHSKTPHHVLTHYCHCMF